MQMIYLDNAATTKIDPLVLDAMMPYLTAEYGNAGTTYSLGRKSKAAIDEARSQVAELISCLPEQIVFTSGGTESNNMVFLGLRDFLKDKNKMHIVTSVTEHDSVLRPIEKMCIKDGFYSTKLCVDERGCVRMSDITRAVNEQTGILSIMYVNNEIGSENPVEEIGSYCRDRGILFHTDCVQAAGSCCIDVHKIGCDFLSISSHKIHGAKGVGALFVKDKSCISPIIYGGYSQEYGMRGGTENVAGIVGFGKACSLMSNQLHKNDIHTSVLKQLFYKSLQDGLSGSGYWERVHINGDIFYKHGKILSLRFNGIDSETLLLMLDAKGVCVSSGSACRSHESEPSRVLLSIGLNEEEARSSIRVSFSKDNTDDEVKEAARIIASCVTALYNI